MVNLKHYDGNAYEFHKSVSDSKRNTTDDPTYKARINALLPLIEQKFEEYSNEFAKNQLTNLQSSNFTDTEISDLSKLYSYKSTLVQKLKIKLTTTINNRVTNTCQYCTIGEVGSFDHVLPKTEFPEYVVNPLNLIPCCSKCNEYKLSRWRNGVVPLYINLYLQMIPVEQFLFVHLTKSNSVFEVDFYLDNPNGIQDDIFNIFVSHYDKLHLCKRFSENANAVVSDMENTVKSFLGKLPNAQIVETFLEVAEKDKNNYGNNYWKSILQVALLNDNTFLGDIFNDVLL